jgi:hypothetical protein
LILAIVVALMAGALGTAGARAQQPPPNEILSQAAANGEEARASFDRLARYEELTIQAVGIGNNVTGEYYRLSRLFQDRSERAAEKVFEEKSTLASDAFISITAVRRLLQIYRFNITREVLQQYEFNYIGRERVDELNTIVFDLRPKDRILGRLNEEARFLKGRVWIDDRDLQVVKVAGEILPHSRPDRTLRFETYFKNYDRYWLPAYTYADEDLRTSDGSIRVIIKVKEYGFGKGGQP